MGKKIYVASPVFEGQPRIYINSESLCMKTCMLLGTKKFVKYVELCLAQPPFKQLIFSFHCTIGLLDFLIFAFIYEDF